MTIAVAAAFLNAGADADDETIRRHMVHAMQFWGHRYPGYGYGIRFNRWLAARYPKAYGSFGNGSAMRASAAGWLFDDEQTVLRMIALAVFCVLFFAVYIAGLYLFPLTAYFENTVTGTLSNAIGMGIANLRQTIIAGAVTMTPLVIAIAWPNLFIQMLFLWMVLGPGAIAYGVTCALTPVFHRYTPEETVEE
jgi:hypothetical protein